ncbi:hypothetical protein ACLBYG_31240 [Methylobacterium sp. D53M]
MEHLWRFFALHAQQRISVFNFFVVLSGVLATAIGGGIQAGRPMALLVTVLGVLLILVSFVFWKLDQRGSDLIKLSESALRAGEAACLPEYARIFRIESQVAGGAAQVDERRPRTRWSFRTAFRLMFLMMALAGASASAYSIFRLIAEPAAKPDGLVRKDGAMDAVGTSKPEQAPKPAAPEPMTVPKAERTPEAEPAPKPNSDALPAAKPEAPPKDR